MFYTRRTIFNRLHTRVCVCVCRVWYRRPSLVSQAAVMSQLESKNQGLVTSMSKSEGGGHHFSSVLLGVHVGPHTSSPSAWPPPKNAISCTHTHKKKTIQGEHKTAQQQTNVQCKNNKPPSASPSPMRSLSNHISQPVLVVFQRLYFQRWQLYKQTTNNECMLHCRKWRRSPECSTPSFFFLGAKSLNLKQNGRLCVSKVLSRYPGRRLKVLQTQSPLFTVSRTPHETH